MEFIGSLEGQLGRPRVALTFDDGPGDVTRQILDSLAAHGARATFFLVGASIAGREPIVREIAAGSHDIGNHTMTHARPLTELLPADVDREIRGASEAIAAATGTRPHLFRPPWLQYNEAVLAAANRAGLKTVVGASVIIPDWTIGSAHTIAELFVSQIQPGSIAVLHDGVVGDTALPTRRPSADAVALILDELRDYEFVTVSQLIARCEHQFSNGPHLVDSQVLLRPLPRSERVG